jgi:general secretion pathway protein G
MQVQTKRLERTERAVRRQGFTLMEVLIVVAIIVMLAGLGGYYLMQQYSGAQISTAKIKVANVSKLAETFRLNNGRFPQSLEELEQQQPNGFAPLAARDDLTDPWGQPLGYDQAGSRNNGLKPDVWANGPNGQIGNWPGGQ